MYLSPAKKHQANAVGLEDSSEVAEKKNDKPIILCVPNPCKVKENKQCQKGLDTQMSPPNPPHLVSFCSHSSLPNPLSKVTEGSTCMACENFREIGRHLEQPLHHAVIDLNISQLPDDVETSHDMIHISRCSSSISENTSPVRTHKGTCQSHTSSTHETPQQVSGSTIEQQQRPPIHQERQQLKMQQTPITPLEQRQPTPPQDQEPNMSGRRQSTRNRPLTTKALEAIESSLIETKSKRKSTDSLTSRPSRQRRIYVSNSTSDSGTGSNETTTGTITEDESKSKKSRITLLVPHN